MIHILDITHGFTLCHLAAQAELRLYTNMAACVLEWIPDSLYNSSISAIVVNYSKFRKDIKSLPDNVQFDVYYKVLWQGVYFTPCGRDVDSSGTSSAGHSKLLAFYQ